MLVRFSALQRAEKSSMERRSVLIHQRRVRFQCSSASRKFLNQTKRSYRSAPAAACFSALQRAENSSITCDQRSESATEMFQCSSASRKFLNTPSPSPTASPGPCFSALQRAENSSMLNEPPGRYEVVGFSALQRAENSSMQGPWRTGDHLERVSVLFSEPKIPQS